jgi:hypothetical protein
MNKLIDPKIANIIKSLPVFDHTVEVTSKKLLLHLTGGSCNSRNQLFSQPHSIKLLTEIVLWGYPADKRGIATRILGPSNLTRLDSIMTAGGWINWGDFFNKIKIVPSVGAVTATKVAYFYKVKLQGLDALILDSRIIKSKKYWHELSHLKFSGAKFNAAQYVAYLNVMHTTANKIGCKPDQIEFFLFALGSSFG